MKKKEKLLQKYLDKRNKLRNRDTLYAQLKTLCEANNKADVPNNKENKKDLERKKKLEKIKMHRRAKEDENHKEVHRVNDDVDCSSHLYEPVRISEDICDREGVYAFDKTDLEEATAFSDKKTDKYNDKAEFLPKQTLKLNFLECENRRPEIEEMRKQLPVYYKQDEIIEAIKSSPITFIQGATGCGKSTQIPQFLYEAGFSDLGLIGITQPRRISAISISARINEEVNENICGYKIKNESEITDSTRIKVMTDGILEREVHSDFILSQYSVIILDEIHERSIDIDILIALLTRIIRIRENPLRLVLMSATSSVTDFEDYLGEFKLINVDTNIHKINIFYEEFMQNYMQKYIYLAFEKIRRIVLSERHTQFKSKKLLRNVPPVVVNDKDAAILVFLTSKQDIYYLKSLIENTGWDVTVVPLHSSLSKAEQSLIYAKLENRKIVLATNIAETGLTIPDVVFVIDTGLAKYKVADCKGAVSYQVDFISKSSAKQRAGRAGRTGPGVCFRLYTGTMYENFVDNILPQILVEPIDGVLLKLLSLGVKNISKFPFLTSPSIASIEESFKTLESLGAIFNHKVTDLGFKMSMYPLPPRLARLLCVGDTQDIFCELVVLLSLISSSFELKKNEETKKYFAGAKSDYIVMLNIFAKFLESSNKVQFCALNEVSYSTFIDVLKTAKQLAIIGNEKLQMIKLDLCEEKCTKLCRIVYYGFVDHLAVYNGESMFFGEEEVLISNNSIEIDSTNVVFEYLVVTENKTYMKNVTMVDKKFY